MNDKKGKKLAVGDFVETSERHINGTEISTLAIIGDIEINSATIILNNRNTPALFITQPNLLVKIKEEDVEEKDRISLNLVKDVYIAMVNDVRFA